MTGKFEKRVRVAWILLWNELAFLVEGLDVELFVRGWHVWVIKGLNPSAWGHLNPSSYCDVGRLFYGVFKLWSKLQRKK